MSTEDIVTALKRTNTPVTRANYIRFNWAEDIPDPWTAEEEDQLPEELQDWDLFTYARGRLTYIGPPPGDEPEPLADAVWREEDHPRGRGDKGGQFIKKGSAAGTLRAGRERAIARREKNASAASGEEPGWRRIALNGGWTPLPPDTFVPKSITARPRAADFTEHRIALFKERHGREPTSDEAEELDLEGMYDFWEAELRAKELIGEWQALPPDVTVARGSRTRTNDFYEHRLAQFVAAHGREPSFEEKALLTKHALSDSRAEKESGPLTAEQRQEQLDAIIAKVSADLGYDSRDVKVVSHEYEFTLEGETRKAGGSYNPATGLVTIYPRGAANLERLPGLLAHEIQHHKYDTVMYAYKNEAAAIQMLPPRESNEFLSARDDTILRGKRGDAARAKYPNYAALHAQFERDNIEKLIEQDGVSDYSAQYWREAAKPAMGMAAVTQGLAINETLAEIAKQDYEGGREELFRRYRLRPDAPWGKLYATINELYDQYMTKLKAKEGSA